MKIEDIVVGERYWVEMSSSIWLCECLGAGDGRVAMNNVDGGYCTSFPAKQIICPFYNKPRKHQPPRWWEFWKRKPAAVSEVRKESPVGEKSKEIDWGVVRLPVGYKTEDIPEGEMRRLARTIRLLPDSILIKRHIALLDACISYVCVNAKPK